MLTIEVELLSGRYVATEHNDRSRAEWPPHPARFYSALVAALHDDDPVDPDERAALLWLELQAPPQIDVDLHVGQRVGRRQVHSVFVPVNDVTLVGDPEREVREARDTLKTLEQATQTGNASDELKRARDQVKKQATKLGDFIEAQNVVDLSPAAAAVKTATALLPDRRIRQERTFPVVVPEKTVFAFFWPEAAVTDHLGALSRLCDRVTRLGHSSSLVRCTVAERAVVPSLVPESSGEHILRVVGPGQLARLEDAYARHQAMEARVLPARPQRYGPPHTVEPGRPRSIFGDEWIVFERVGGDRPLASRGSDLATALRRTLVEMNGSEDLPPVLSGHGANGERASQPHLAFVSLPWVGHGHADGSVQGVALVPPRSIASHDREMLLRLLAKWERERGNETDGYSVELGTPAGLGRSLQVRVRRVEVPAKAALAPSRWCRISRRFISATPIALDRNPGNLRSNHERTAHKAAAEAESSIADACERIGLPRPTSVLISFAPLLPGSQHVRQFDQWPPQPGKLRRVRVHADISFAAAVCGPVLIGAGRYFGLGLCLPVAERAPGAAESKGL